MKLKLLTSEKSLFEGNVSQVTVPGALGPFTVLEGHAPLVSTLVSGKLSYTEEPSGKRAEWTVKGGIAEVHDDTVVVCLA